jgi:hypothetical protein
MPGAWLNQRLVGKVLSEMPALKPDPGKRAVRNFRGENGNGFVPRHSPTRELNVSESSRIAPVARPFLHVREVLRLP